MGCVRNGLNITFDRLNDEIITEEARLTVMDTSLFITIPVIIFFETAQPTDRETTNFFRFRRLSGKFAINGM